jgi:hypothetical protein
MVPARTSAPIPFLHNMPELSPLSRSDPRLRSRQWIWAINAVISFSSTLTALTAALDALAPARAEVLATVAKPDEGAAAGGRVA